MISDATALAFKPDGQQVAVATMNGHITFFNPTTGQFKIESQKNVQIQCNLDLVTFNMWFSDYFTKTIFQFTT